MYNIFQTPWPIAIASVAAWLIVSVIRLSMPDKARIWHMLIPLVMLISAFIIDYLVKTDHEKLDTVIDDSIAATIACDIPAFENIVSENYSDTVHKSKPEVIAAAKKYLSEPVIEKIYKTNCLITVNNASANINIEAMVYLDPKSKYAVYGRVAPIKMVVKCTKTQDGIWRVSSADITEINKTKASWNSF